MKLLFLQLFLLSFLTLKSFATPFLLTEEEKEFIKKNPVVTIGMLQEFKKFSYFKDNQAVGFEHDLLKIISSKTGLQFEKKINHWPIIYNAFKDKKTDMVASISQTDYRSKFTLYTLPYYKTPVMVFIRDDYKNYNGFKNIKEKKVGVIGNAFYLARLKRIPDLELVYYDSYEKIVQALFLGNIDVMIHNIAAVQAIINANGYTNIIGEEIFPLNESNIKDLRFGIQSSNVLLHSIIQKAIDSISKKSYNKLIDKWLIKNYTKPINYTLILMITIGTILLISIILYIRMKKNNKKLEHLVITDKLTNLYNRRKLEEILQTEINRSERFKSTFSLVILDIDYFKDVNDTYGHQIGDIVLIEFANILKDTLRKTDFIGRFGGEEFMIICPEINENEIFKVVESLRLKIANTNFEKVGYKTASFGLTIYKKNDTINSIIKRADDALYEAKNAGRNKSIIYTS